MAAKQWLEFTPMKYFTKDWYEGNYSEKEIIEIRDSYWTHIKAIKSRLPKQYLKNITL